MRAAWEVSKGTYDSRPMRLQKVRGAASVVRLKDFGVLAYVFFAGLVAMIVPERLWPFVTNAAARIVVQLRPRRATSRIRRLEAWGVTAQADTNLSDIVVGTFANDMTARLLGLRCALRRSWRPRVRLEGIEHIERALSGGRGVVLWVAPTSWHTIATKTAFHVAGVEVSHLSTEEHGFSSSRIGVQFLNPLWVRAEDRFLSERLVMTAGERGDALRELIDRVRAGGAVSITAGPEGKRANDVPMLAGSIRLASGAPSLALRTGASLLPVWTTRRSDGVYVTTVAPPLEMGDRGADGVLMLTAGFASQLSSIVSAHPSQWQAWRDE
jgi:lauroyl/myristoyl acyltransferase